MLSGEYSSSNHYGYSEIGGVDTWVTTERLMLCAGQNRDAAVLESAIRPLINQKSIVALTELGALHWACYLGQIQLIRELVALDIPPDSPERLYGNTPCHFALKGLQIEAAELLIQFGGRSLLHVTNYKGRTPFLVTVAEASLEKPIKTFRALEWLLLNGISTETQDDKGETALFLAIRRNSMPLVQFLLSRGAYLGHRDLTGTTALHVAVKDADEAIIPYLCEKGAIALVPCKSHDGNCFKLLLRCLRYFLWLSLWKWFLCHRYFGFVRLFKSAYASYYWACTIFNLVIFCALEATKVEEFSPTLSKVWLGLFASTQLWWLVAYSSDPGIVRQNVVPSQAQKIRTSMSETLRHGPQYTARVGSAEGQLQVLEFTKLKANYKIYSSVEALAVTKGRMEIAELQAQAALLSRKVGKERRALLPSDYLAAIMHPSTASSPACLTCRITKPLRTHHCAECGHCLMREDHHCVWLDNCVATKNQRSFWLFLFSILCLLVCNFAHYASYAYVQFPYWVQQAAQANWTPLVLWAILLVVQIL